MLLFSGAARTSDRIPLHLKFSRPLFRFMGENNTSKSVTELSRGDVSFGEQQTDPKLNTNLTFFNQCPSFLLSHSNRMHYCGRKRAVLGTYKASTISVLQWRPLNKLLFRIVTQTHMILERSKSCSPRCETSADSQGNTESQKNERSLVKCRPSAGRKLHMGRHVKSVNIKYEHLV